MELAGLHSAPRSPLDSERDDSGGERAVGRRATTNERQVTLERSGRVIDAVDVWDFVHTHATPGDAVFVARLPDRQGEFAAVGSVVAVRADGAQRFDVVREAAAGWRKRLVERTPAPCAQAPLWVGGFAFDGGPLAAPWQTWSGAWWWIPRHLYWRDATDGAWHLENRILGRPPTADAGANSNPNADAMADTNSTRDPGPMADLDSRAGAPSASGARSRDVQPAETDEPAFCAAVTLAVQSIAAGKLDKVVLARAHRATAAAGTRYGGAETFAAATARDTRALCFAIGRMGHGMFVGATPELLVDVRGAHVCTTALAGTAPRHAEPTEDARRASELLLRGKDQREHAWVERALHETLAEHCTSVTSGPTGLRSTPDMHHLETPLAGVQRRSDGVVTWIERFHPSPAVAGTPRQAALAQLRRSEPTERGWYAGPIGYATATGDGAAWVAIRSAHLEGDRALLYAGAGIVRDSVAQNEWAETELKLGSMRAALRTKAAEPT